MTWRHSGIVDQFHGPDARHVIFNDWDDPWTDTALALVSHIKGRIGTPFRCDLVVGLPSDLGLTQVRMITISLLNSGKVAFCGNSVRIMAIRTALLWRVNARRPPPRLVNALQSIRHRQLVISINYPLSVINSIFIKVIFSIV